MQKHQLEIAFLAYLTRFHVIFAVRITGITLLKLTACIKLINDVITAQKSVITSVVR